MSCCWLLQSSNCRRICHTQMRTVTLPIEDRLMLKHECIKKKFEPRGDCMDDSRKKKHLCYSECVALMAFKTKQDSSFKFNPRLHCSHFATDPIGNVCIGEPLKK